MTSLGVPASMSSGPFSVAEARAEGFEWDSLQGSRFRRVRRGQYCLSIHQDSLLLRLAGVLRTLPDGSAFCGLTAFAVEGLDVGGTDPIEVSVTRDVGVAARAGIRISRRRRSEEEIYIRNGLPITTPIRTAFDLACRPGLVRAVMQIEMAATAGLVDLDALRRFVGDRAGVKGVKRARRAVLLTRPGAESPPETQLRLIAVLAGLPEPQIQHEVRDNSGSFLARADLCYPEARLILEYDGAYHADSVTADDRRQNRLVTNDWYVLRFARGDLSHPNNVAEIIGKALVARGVRIGRLIRL